METNVKPNGEKKGAVASWLDKRKERLELKLAYEKYKFDKAKGGKEFTPSSVVDKYNGLQGGEKKKFREKLAFDLEDAKDYESLYPLLELTSAIGDATAWGDAEFDAHLAGQLLDVVEEYDAANGNTVLGARKAVEALWNCNYWKGEFWEGLLGHKDDGITYFVIKKLRETQGGDEVLKKGVATILAKLYASPSARAYIVQDFDKLAAETRQNVLDNFRASGVPVDMLPLLPTLIDYPETKQGLLRDIAEKGGIPIAKNMPLHVNIKVEAKPGEKIDLAELQKKTKEIIEKTVGALVADAMSKIVEKLKGLVDGLGGEEKVLAASIMKSRGVKELPALDGETLGTLKSMVLREGTASKISATAVSLLLNEKSPEAAQVEEEIIEEGKRLFDEPEKKEQVEGYKLIKMLYFSGSEKAKEAMAGIKSEMELVLNSANVTDEDRKLAKSILEDIEKFSK